jgi:streptogramin lyase
MQAHNAHVQTLPLPNGHAITIDARVMAASSMHAMGMTTGPIAETMSVDPATVWRWLQLPESVQIVRMIRDNAVSAAASMTTANICQ